MTRRLRRDGPRNTFAYGAQVLPPEDGLVSLGGVPNSPLMPPHMVEMSNRLLAPVSVKMFPGSPEGQFSLERPPHSPRGRFPRKVGGHHTQISPVKISPKF